MISRSHRFHGRGSLRFVYQKGQTIRSGQLILRWAKNDRRQQYRAAVVVSRKVHKSAVVRNRIRRRIYEIVREHYKQQPNQAYDLVFTVFTDRLAGGSAEAVQQAVDGLLAQLPVLPSDTGGRVI